MVVPLQQVTVPVKGSQDTQQALIASLQKYLDRARAKVERQQTVLQKVIEVMPFIPSIQSVSLSRVRMLSLF